MPVSSTSYKILSNSLLLCLGQCVQEINGDNEFCFVVTYQLLISFLYSSDTGEKTGVEIDSASTIHRPQENI
jgi:hypothetical protein